MKPSIKLKIFVSISCLILFFVVLTLLFNSFLLEKYYVYSKRNTLIDSYNKINNSYKGDTDAILIELEKLESNKGMHIVILDTNLRIKYIFNQKLLNSVLGKKEKYDRPPDLKDIRGLIEMSPSHYLERIKQEGDPIIETGEDIKLNTSFIRLIAMLNNGDYIVLSTSMAAIEESAYIANKFSLFNGLFTIILGFIFIYFISKKFTDPILQLNNITKEMARLDFSKRYSVKSDDEIGQLGSSINSLSKQLEKSINDFTQANKKLKEDIDKERKIDEMRKEFISNVSHELKTPIALIQGYAEGLKVNVNEDEENKNFYCEIIMSEAAKMNRLVKQLLDLSKMESGMINLEKTDFSISELVDNVLRKNSLVIKENAINMATEGGEDILVNADFDKAEQVLTNYLNNAIDHVDEEKIIKITTEKIEEKARIAVFNSGEPIPDESLDKIWMSFYKVDKARTRAFGGTGLGLSIVKAIQDAHNNTYGVGNVSGGVEFWFELDIS